VVSDVSQGRTEELRAAFTRKVPKRVEPVLAQMAQALEPSERILDAVTGSWRRGQDCAVVLTSRQLLIGGGGDLQAYPLASVLEASLQERWRKGDLTVRMIGQVADVTGIHLDDARQIERNIQTGIRLRSAT
jgi:hypothetical protein